MKLPKFQIAWTWSRGIPAWTALALVLSVWATQLSAQDEVADEASARKVLLVNTVVARLETSITQKSSFTGIVRARRTSELSFDRGGRVDRVQVAAGEIVESGQSLAQLDSRRLEIKKDNLESALARARDAWEQLEPAAETATDQQLQSTLQQLRGELNQLERDLTARSSPANQSPNSSRSLADRVNDLERQLGILNQISRQQKIDAQSKLVSELEGQLEDLELQIGDATLKAPFAGMIAARHIDEGTVVSAGRPLFTLVEQQVLSVWVGVPADIAAQTRVGESLAVDLGGQTFSGSVRAKLPQLDRTTRTRVVILNLPASAADQVLPGAVARVGIRTQNELAGFWLPISAIQRDLRGLWSVFVVENVSDQPTVARRIIELLHVEMERVLVRGTLQDGDVVIADGTHRIVPGQKVRSKDVSAEFSASAISQDPS